jgi:hypothetical protein
MQAYGLATEILAQLVSTGARERAHGEGSRRRGAEHLGRWAEYRGPRHGL